MKILCNIIIIDILLLA